MLKKIVANTDVDIRTDRPNDIDLIPKSKENLTLAVKYLCTEFQSCTIRSI